MKEEILVSVIYDKVFVLWNKLTGWFNIFFCYSKCWSLVISTIEFRGNYNCYSTKNDEFESKFAQCIHAQYLIMLLG